MDYKLEPDSSEQIRKWIKNGIDVLSAAALLILYFVMIAAFITVINMNPPLNAQQVKGIPLSGPSPTTSPSEHFMRPMNPWIPVEVEE